MVDCDLDVRIIAPHEMGPSERAVWDFARAGDPAHASPFFSFEFLMIAGRHAPCARVAVIERHGRVVGFLPFQCRPGGRARPLGAPLADAHGPVVLPGEAVDLVTVVRRAGLPAFSFTAAAPRGGVFNRIDVRRHPAWIVDLAAGVEAYWQDRRAAEPDFVRQLSRRGRLALREEGTIARQRSPRRRDWDLLIARKRAQYRATGRHDLFETRWVMAMMEDLREGEGALGGVTSRLDLGGRAAAWEFGLSENGIYHSWLPVFDPWAARYSPGHLLLAEIARAGAAEGWSRVDLGTGAASTKRLWANATEDRLHGVAAHGVVRSLVMRGLDSVMASDAAPAFARVLAPALRRWEQITTLETRWRDRAGGAARALRGRLVPQRRSTRCWVEKT
jgi:CelD/BcsL family acetyltransferase involved in cellulose biosynthesis